MTRPAEYLTLGFFFRLKEFALVSEESVKYICDDTYFSLLFGFWIRENLKELCSHKASQTLTWRRSGKF